MFPSTIYNWFRYGIALGAMLVCTVAYAGDQEFSSVMAWGKLQMFKSCEKGALMHRTFDPRSQEWSPWVSIAKFEITSSPSAVLTDEGSRLAVYFRGKDGRLHQVYRDRETGWSTVAAFGDRRMYSGPTAVVVEGVLTVFAREADCRLMKIYYDKALGSWTKWIDVEPPLNPFGKIAGKWKVEYSHGPVRFYTINENGKVTATVDQATMEGQLTIKDRQLLLTLEGDGKLERVTLGQDGRLFIEHYNPKENYPTKPNVTGIGSRQGRPLQESAWESKVVLIGNDENEATKKYAELKAAGWELEGPVGNGLAAFRRPIKVDVETSQRDLEVLQGTWTTVSLAFGNVQVGENKTDTITYDKNTYVQRRDGQIIAAGTFTIVDAAAYPKRIDYQCTEGPFKGTIYRGIYSILGDDHRICMDDGNDKRPTEFSGKTGIYRVTKRDK